MISLDVNTNLEPEIVGAHQASEEDQQLLEDVMDSIERAIHGEFRDDVVNVINSSPDLYLGVSQLASMITARASHNLDEQQIPNDGAVFFGENGAIQETVELLWEVAEAVGHPQAEDEDQFHGAYLATLETLGEIMFEDEESAREAQDFLLEQEFGVDLVQLAANELENESEAEETTGLLGGLRDRGSRFLDSLRSGVSIGPTREEGAAPGRRAIRAGSRDVQLRDELDPNERLRRQMEEAGID